MEAFLSADVGLQANGMPLNVLSMLARQDIDPWDETAHLCKMPRGEAVARLSGLIAAASVAQPDRRSVSHHASDLIALLPSFAGAAQNAVKPPPEDGPADGSRSIQPLNRHAFYRRLLLVAVAALIVTAIAITAPPAKVQPAGGAASTSAPSAPSFQPHHF